MVTILIDKTIMAPMRDELRLATDGYREEGAPPAPVLLARTAYNTDHALASCGVPFDIMRAVQAGYVVVVQDVCRRFASEFNAHFQERDDGMDCIAWAATQPWSSGLVGMSAAPASAAPNGCPHANSCSWMDRR